MEAGKSLIILSYDALLPNSRKKFAARNPHGEQVAVNKLYEF